MPILCGFRGSSGDLRKVAKISLLLTYSGGVFMRGGYAGGVSSRPTEKGTWVNPNERSKHKGLCPKGERENGLYTAPMGK